MNSASGLAMAAHGVGSVRDRLSVSGRLMTRFSQCQRRCCANRLTSLRLIHYGRAVNSKRRKAMSLQITGATIDQLSKKLEAFSASLSDAERTLFKGMLEGHGLS